MINIIDNFFLPQNNTLDISCRHNKNKSCLLQKSREISSENAAVVIGAFKKGQNSLYCVLAF